MSRLTRAKRKAHDALTAGDLAKADRWVAEATNMAWEDPEGLYMAGVLLRDTGHIGIAANLFRRCIAIEKSHPNPWLLYGACLHDLHEYEQAIDVFKKVLQERPGEPSVFQNLAASYVQMGQFSEAYSYAKECLRRKPDSAPAKAVLGLAALGLERWREGFENYQHMIGVRIKERSYGDENQPEWDGNPGQTIVVQGDQGVGDEIRFSSIIPDAARICKKLVYDCHPKLVNVFKRSFPNVDVYGTRKDMVVDWLDNYRLDARVNVCALGKFFRSKASEFPRKPYLVPHQGLREKWRKILARYPRPYVGVAWQGGSVQTLREMRSLDIEQFRPLVDVGGSFIDLSYHDSQMEVERFNEGESQILHFEVDQSDYDDTLALVAELDLVVCVPTTIMHAAGSIGKACWVMVPSWPQWEFGNNRSDMIWYGRDLIRQFRCASPNLGETLPPITEEYRRYFHASGFHRDGPTPAVSVHGPAKLDHPEGEQAGLDNSIVIAAASYKKGRANGIHF